MSGPGWVLFVCALMLGASAFPSVRPKVFGLLVHPLTLAAGILFLAGIGRLRRFPRSIGLALAAFTAVFGFAALIGPPGGVPFAVKVLASAVTLVVGGIYVENERDQRAVVVAFTLAVALISVRGLYVLGGMGVHGINPMEGIANKNGFSLFALPALLLAGLTAIKPSTPIGQRWALIAGMLFIVFAVFSTANRSGWIGVFLVAVLLMVRAVRRLRTLLLSVTVTVLGGTIVTVYADRSVIQDRLDKTNAEAPQLRLALVAAAFKVSVDNPLLGASPQALPREMSRQSGGVRGHAYDTHNTTALLVGGTGLLGVLGFLGLGWSLWRRPRWFDRATPEQRDAHYLLRAMLILWAVRGQFTSEILFSPAFSLALGICIGGGVAAGVWGPGPPVLIRRLIRRPAPAQPLPAPPPTTGLPA